MSALQRFKAGLKMAAEKKYEPKFAVGDTIFCSKFKTARRILAIKELEWDMSGQLTMYKLLELKSNRYETLREAYKIDYGYVKVNEKAVEILYGKK